MTRTFVALKQFDSEWERLGLDDIDLKQLQQQLTEDPNAGDMMRGTHGCRKLRVSLDNRGKSGGARVIYVDFIRFEKLYLLSVYPKNEKVNLTRQESNEIKELVKKLETVERENYERRMNHECI